MFIIIVDFSVLAKRSLESGLDRNDVDDFDRDRASVDRAAWVASDINTHMIEGSVRLASTTEVQSRESASKLSNERKISKQNQNRRDAMSSKIKNTASVTQRKSKRNRAKYVFKKVP